MQLAGQEEQLRPTGPGPRPRQRILAVGWAALVLVMALAACGPSRPAAEVRSQEPPVCTAEGICVHERFREYYRQHGDLIGPPIAEPGTYRERLVQYFRAGRLEYVPENPPGYEVGLAYLGEELCGRQPPLHYSQVPSRLEREVEYYPQTGHSLRGAFLRFVQENGGVDVFGPPISEPRLVGGETVQDFVRVQLRQAEDGTFYLAPLGGIMLGREQASAGLLCPSVPPDDPHAQAGQPDGGQDDGGHLPGQ
jgi:hypothetical protein